MKCDGAFCFVDGICSKMTADFQNGIFVFLRGAFREICGREVYAICLKYFYHVLAVSSKNGNTSGGFSIIGHLPPVWQDFVGGSETPGADKQFRLGKDRHCYEREREEERALY